MQKIIVLLNAYTQGKSGGDVCCIESVKRFKNCEMIVITSQLGKELCENLGLKAKFLLTTSEKYFGNVYSTYLTRIIKGIFIVILHSIRHSRENGNLFLDPRLRGDDSDVRSRVPPKAGRQARMTNIVYVSSDTLPDVLPALFIKLLNPKIFWLQKIYHLIPRKRWLSFSLQKLSLLIIKKFSQIIIVDNPLIKSELIKLNFPKELIRINYPGVDKEKLNKIPRKKIKYTGVYLGRLHETKGVLDLPFIWKEVVEQVPDAKFAIIGTGNEQIMKNLQFTIYNLHLNNNIDLLGFLEDKEAYTIVKNSKVLLFPSYEEGFGMVIAEALYLGTQVVSYDLENFKIFKNTINTVEIGDTENFAVKVIQISGRQKKKSVLDNFIRSLSWDRYAEKEQQLFSTTHLLSSRT